jgi:hypothetical protein
MAGGSGEGDDAFEGTLGMMPIYNSFRYIYQR